MELKDFIKESLEGIAEGIIESNLALSNKDFIVSPSINRTNNRCHDELHLVQSIDFHVVVEESRKDGEKGKLDVKFLKIGSESKEEGRYCNTLSFKIPVIYPQFHFLLSEKVFKPYDSEDSTDNHNKYTYEDIQS